MAVETQTVFVLPEKFEKLKFTQYEVLCLLFIIEDMLINFK